MNRLIFVDDDLLKKRAPAPLFRGLAGVVAHCKNHPFKKGFWKLNLGNWK